MKIKSYLSKSLRLKSQGRRGVAYINQGNVVIHHGTKGGYDLGTADALKHLIIETEKLPDDMTLG